MVLHFSNLNFITSFALINENSTLLSQSVGKKKNRTKLVCILTGNVSVTFWWQVKKKLCNTDKWSINTWEETATDAKAFCHYSVFLKDYFIYLIVGRNSYKVFYQNLRLLISARFKFYHIRDFNFPRKLNFNLSRDFRFLQL